MPSESQKMGRERIHQVPMGRRRSVDGQRDDKITFQIPKCIQDQSDARYEVGMVERDDYVFGPNLRQEFFADIVLGLQNVSHDLGDGCELEHGKDKPVFWMVDRGL